MTVAIGHAQMVLSWLENLPSDDQPPQWMWTVDHEIEVWFERLSEERDRKFEDAPSGPMMENELAADMRKRH